MCQFELTGEGFENPSPHSRNRKSQSLPSLLLFTASSPSSFLCPLCSPGSDSGGQHLNSSSEGLPSSTVAPLNLSLSPAVSPEEFEHLWLQRHALHSEQGNETEQRWSHLFFPWVRTVTDRSMRGCRKHTTLHSCCVMAKYYTLTAPYSHLWKLHSACTIQIYLFFTNINVLITC